MAKFSDIKKDLSNMEKLERELNLKQLQVNRLLNITQAINNNVSSEGLFNMYHSFLSWEMGIKKMALYIKENKEWKCTSSIGIDDQLLKMDISNQLGKYVRLKNIDNEIKHPLIKEFDIIIPVLHKETPIAYAFIGGFGDDEDMYNKVQFITTITNIIAVAIENKRLFKQQIKQERLRREMELASQMQEKLIPSKLPKSDYYELASIYKPHLGVGGDYFDFVQFSEDEFAFCIGDISGKGIAAALLMANFQANFHTLINKRFELKDLIKELNQSVIRITNGERFITFFVAEFDKKTRELTYINAGHNPPLLIMNGRNYPLDKGCTILGSFKELPVVEVGRQIIEDEEAMVLTYTDGLTDIKNEEGHFFDEKYLHDFALENYSASAEVFNKRLLEKIELYKGDLDYPDDCTVLTCKFLKPPN